MPFIETGPCIVCGTHLVAGMCPARYLMPHTQRWQDRAARVLVAFGPETWKRWTEKHLARRNHLRTAGRKPATENSV